MKKIKLGGKRGIGKYAIVDDEDFELLNTFNWSININRYAEGRVNGLRVRMHQLICKASTGKVVDHINGNPLDNRRNNLRACTQSENLMNIKNARKHTSQFKGVGWHKQHKKWRAFIRTLGKMQHLGLFNKEEEAARAYNEAAQKYFGEFANLNVIN